MAGNIFGKAFQYISWGESHGPAIGCVVDGVPSNIDLCEDDIQFWLDKRKPGSSKFTTQRKEDDKVKILSGVFENKTTGTPISLIIENTDQRSKDYSAIKDLFRPGHADYTYHHKYGHRDYRGGGRASARETASRVAAGAIARKIIEQRLSSDISIQAAVIQIGDVRVDEKDLDWSETRNNSFWCPNAIIAKKWEDLLLKVRKNGSSVGALIELKVSGVPVGLGEPVYDKLDSELSKAMMSINAAKGVEIGSGFNTVSFSGEENADEIYADEQKKVHFKHNHSGGILGGISSGQDISLKVAFKPTSSVLTKLKTIDCNYNNTEIQTKGRHDPCVGIRAVPVVEAMAASVIADHFLRYKILK